MKRSLIYIVLMLLTVYSFSFAENTEYEFWSWSTFNFRLNESWKVKIREDFRFSGGSFSEYQNYVYFDFDDLPKNIDFGVGYRLIYDKDSNGQFRQENRPFIDFTINTALFGLKCSDRNRLEYRDFENKDDVFRYRNQLKFSSAQDLFNLPLHPYIGDEIFIQENKGLYRNWIRGGIIWDINEQFDINFFGIYQIEQKNSDWEDLLIGGFEMIFSF